MEFAGIYVEGKHMSDYLIHFGILGQRWGVRRFQNKDGSLTTAGKTRYRRASDVRKDINDSLKQNVEKVNEIYKKSEDIERMANDLGAKYGQEYKNIQLDKDTRDRIYKMAEEYSFGDPYWLDDELEDMISETIDSQVSKKLSKERQKLDKMQDEFWNERREITENIVNKYQDEKLINDRGKLEDGKLLVNQIINETVGASTNSAYVSYLGRHFDDYWVDDIDSRYEAIYRIKSQIMKENKKGE